MLRRILLALVLALPVLLVVFAVVMAGYALTTATQDVLASRVLWWLGMSCLMLLAVDLILLVAALGLVAVVVEGEPDRDDRPRSTD